MVDWF